MSSAVDDRWARWLRDTRFGGDERVAAMMLRRLAPVRDRVLDGARLSAGETLLDAGCGEGLIGFAALERVGESGHVVFADISGALLEHCREHARDIGATGRCTFVEAPAETLPGIVDASVDAVATRSVLIYVKGKASAFRSFHRVLRPAGRISLFEPINRFEREFAGPGGGGLAASAPAVSDLVKRLADHFAALQPDDDPMLDFDERSLLRLCEDAGFERIKITLEITARASEPVPWQVALKQSGNPNIPTWGAVMDEIFSEAERARFEQHVRPLIEGGGLRARAAVAYVTATKPAGPHAEEGR